MQEKAPGRILAVDLGIKRMGLAISDELRISSRPLHTRVPKSRRKDVIDLLQICAEMDVTVVLIGYPLLPRSQTEGFMARRARGFAQAMHEAACDSHLSIEIRLQDEFATSKQARENLRSTGLTLKKQQALEDEEAARLLIDDYLTQNLTFNSL